MTLILNKQARFITVPYLNEHGHRKTIRLFGYTTDLTDEEIEVVRNHKLLQQWFKTGELKIVEEETVHSVQLVNNAPIANGVDGSYPISSNTDKKVNDKIFKKLEGMAADGSEVELEKVVPPAPKEAKKTTTRSKSTSSDK